MHDFFLNNIDWIIPTIASALFSLAAFILSLISLIYTYRMQKENMRFQLSSKRYELYNKFKSLYYEVSDEKKVTDSISTSFEKLTQEAKFLFDEDILQCCVNTLSFFDCHMYTSTHSNTYEYMLIQEKATELNVNFYEACLHLISQEAKEMANLMPRYIEFSKYKKRQRIINHNNGSNACY